MPLVTLHLSQLSSVNFFCYHLHTTHIFATFFADCVCMKESQQASPLPTCQSFPSFLLQSGRVSHEVASLILKKEFIFSSLTKYVITLQTTSWHSVLISYFPRLATGALRNLSNTRKRTQTLISLSAKFENDLHTCIYMWIVGALFCYFKYDLDNIHMKKEYFLSIKD